MKGLILCYKGLEDVSKLEVKEIISQNCSVYNGAIIFDISSFDDLAKLTYYGQSFKNVLLLLTCDKKIVIDNVLKGIVKDKTFAVRSFSDEKSSQEISDEVAEKIIELYNPAVNLKKPDVQIIAYYSDDTYFIGLDFAYIDLAKRDYKLYSSAASLKGPIAYCLVRLSGYTGKERLLDPFNRSGEIVIEAAYFASKKSINHFRNSQLAFHNFTKVEFKDKEQKHSDILAYSNLIPSLTNSRKNAKIGGVEDDIHFTRVDLDWLDLKQEQNSVDLIVTNPPRFSKFKPLDKIYKELFYQAEYILKPKGTITLITNNPDLEGDKFKVIHKRDVFAGKEKLHIIIFEKTT